MPRFNNIMSRRFPDYRQGQGIQGEETAEAQNLPAVSHREV